jgi:hypothetical protein
MRSFKYPPSCPSWAGSTGSPLALLGAGLGVAFGEDRAFRLGLLVLAVSALRLILGGGLF